MDLLNAWLHWLTTPMDFPTSVVTLLALLARTIPLLGLLVLGVLFLAGFIYALYCLYVFAAAVVTGYLGRERPPL